LSGNSASANRAGSGASDAISAVPGACLLYYPPARVTVLIPLGIILLTVRWPAGWVPGAWFVLQVGSSLLRDPALPGVAWLAHVRGFCQWPAAGPGIAPVTRGQWSLRPGDLSDCFDDGIVSLCLLNILCARQIAGAPGLKNINERPSTLTTEPCHGAE